MSLKNIKLSVPTYKEVVPSTKKKITMQPFRVGDEKTLLMAAQSTNLSDMMDALKSVISNCVKGVKVEELQSYDLEYLFLKIRSKSIGEISNIGITCAKCEANNSIDIDLSTVEVKFNKDHKDLIKIEETLAFQMKTPDTADISELNFEDAEGLLEIIIRSVKTVFTGDEQIDITPEEYDDLKDIVESMTRPQFQTITKFFETIPKVSKDITFECGKCGEHNETVIEGLANFF